MGMNINQRDIEDIPLWKLQQKFEFFADYVEEQNQKIKQAQKK